MIGGDGQNLIEFTGRWGHQEFDLATGEVGSFRQVSVSGVEHVNGHENGETLRGNDAANRLHGRGGDDRLVGRAGDDSLFGGDGYDRIWGDAGTDLIDGGDGVDWLEYYASPAAVTVDLAAGTGLGGDAEGDTILHIENVIGSGFADRISGDAADNRIEGGAGADTLSGGDGTLDFLAYSRSGSAVTVDLGAGTASGGHAEGDVISGFEAIAGSSHDDFLYGDDGDNAIGGGDGSDFISGGDGNDFLKGGRGFGRDLAEDTLMGGDGADRFFGGTRVFDIVLDYSDTEGDVLVFARRPSSRSEFVATVGHFQDASGAALGDDDVMDVRIGLEGGTTGNFWILADGAELDHIFMRSMGGPTFDLLEG
ncbi:MAG: calcium-binding protein [Jhaorihella sp.]